MLLILDELPATTLMRADGSLNEERFPGFARLAEKAFWFRNASSRHPETTVSVPHILTGQLGDESDPPTERSHPQNLFTLLGATPDMPVQRYELVTDMCPPDICEPLISNPFRQAMKDAAVVYGRRVLPEPLRHDLPRVDQSWGGFGEQLGGLDDAVEFRGMPTADNPDTRVLSLDEAELSKVGQATIADQMITAIDAEPSVHFIHVALPHFPWTLTPWGHEITPVPLEVTGLEPRLDPDDPGFELDAVQRYQLHSMQTGVTDVMVGGLVEHLERVGVWEEALVVVTSDHGVGLLPPDFGRTLTDGNREELLRVPLFIKAPGQTQGEVRDDVAQTIDVLPSIVDLLDIDTDWDLDGRSLFDGDTRPQVDPVVDPDVGTAIEIAAQHGANTPHGDDWVGLAAVGDHGALVGTPLDELTIGEPSDLVWQLDVADDLESLPGDDGRMPQVLTGTVTTPDRQRPPELVVEINGTLAGVIGAYQPDGDRWRFTGFMAPLYQPGPNTVTGYHVDTTTNQPTLHPLTAE